MASPEQRAAWLKLTTQFRLKYPHIKIKFRNMDNVKYHKFMSDWHNSDTDIIYGFAGQRLFEYVAAGNVHNINHLWNNNQWDSEFKNAKPNVSVAGQVYAVPISFYQWGFYYNREIFKELGLKAPKNWTEFAAVCEAIKSSGKYPVITGYKDDWPAASWFSYFNLRLNGRDFHLKLLRGEVSFKDQRLLPVLAHWQTLIDAEYFHPKGERAKIEQVLVYLYRNEATMTLSGNFIMKHMDDDYRDNFGFFGFPIIDDTLDRYEEAPTDVLFINQYSQHKAAAETFLKFMAQPSILAEFNDSVGYISPNHKSPPSQNKFIRTGANWLQTANGNTMYLDRDTQSEFANIAFKALGDFMRQPNKKRLINQLEEARISSLLRKEDEK